MSHILVRPLLISDATWAARVLTERWASTRVVSRGQVHDAMALPGFVAVVDGARAGLATYRVDGADCELVTVNSLAEGRGAGTALVEAVKAEAARLEYRRLWLVTTNDNTHALRFYQRRGFRLAALRAGAIAESRRIKPEIPEMGNDGIPIRDEIELEIELP